MNPVSVAIVVTLIVLGGALPIVGLSRVAFRAHRNLPDADRISAAEMMEEGRNTGLWPTEAFVFAGS